MRDLLEKVYKGLIEQLEKDHFGHWQWNEGVMLYGLVKAYEVTGSEEIIGFLKRWTDYHLKRADFGLSINTTAPLLGVMKLLEGEPENPKYREVCERFAKWCMCEAPRADLGAFEHSCTHNRYPNEIWADTLFMGCIFLVKWGVFTGDDMYIKEALRQFRLHYHFLQDEKTALIYHGYDCNVRAPMGVLWGRGNCWLAVAALEALELIGERIDGYLEFKSMYSVFMKGVIVHQDAVGGFHTVLDREDTYTEMSATAAFAYSILKASRLGILSEDQRESGIRALRALTDDIDETGRVKHGSGGTCVMKNASDYNGIPYAYAYYTQGLALMALSEAKR